MTEPVRRVRKKKEPDGVVRAVVDASFLLQGQHVEQVDWRALLGAPRVEVVLSAAVVDQLSKDPQARETVRHLEALLVGKQGVAELGNETKLRLAEPLRAAQYERMKLDRGFTDDELLAQCLKQLADKQEVVLVSASGGLRLRADSRGIRLATLPERSAPPPAPRTAPVVTHDGLRLAPLARPLGALTHRAILEHELSRPGVAPDYRRRVSEFLFAARTELDRLSRTFCVPLTVENSAPGDALDVHVVLQISRQQLAEVAPVCARLPDPPAKSAQLEAVAALISPQARDLRMDPAGWRVRRDTTSGEFRFVADTGVGRVQRAHALPPLFVEFANRDDVKPFEVVAQVLAKGVDHPAEQTLHIPAAL